MPGTFTNLLFHIIFSTKLRQPLITPEVRPRLYDYLGGCIRGEGGVLYSIGGIADHVHLLIRWRADAAISDLLRDIKGGSSRWAHDALGVREFRW
jgi:REP element-mobilizing transposase RayT